MWLKFRLVAILQTVTLQSCVCVCVNELVIKTHNLQRLLKESSAWNLATGSQFPLVSLLSHGVALLYSISVLSLSTAPSLLLHPFAPCCVPSAVTGAWWGRRPADLNVLICPIVLSSSWTQHQSCSSNHSASRSLSFLTNKYSSLEAWLCESCRENKRVIVFTTGFV